MNVASHHTIPFLRSVAIEVVARTGYDLRNKCFVLPGKRACLFLERHLNDVIEQNYGHTPARGERPMLMTFAEFTEKITGRRTGSRLELLFALYATWRVLAGDAQDFDTFRTWGDTVLSDFDEIDRYEVDAAGLFHGIETHNEISTDYLTDEQRLVVEEYFGVKRESRNKARMWSHMQGNSQTKRRYRELWQMLGPLYEQFNRSLEALDFSYGGALARKAATLLESQGAKVLPAPEVILVGFDALTTGQLRMFDVLKRLGADFFWDAPGPALAPESPVDAGRFQWQNMRRYPCSVPGFESYVKELQMPQVMDVIACPGNSAQAKVTSMLLDDIASGRGREFTDPARVAVVLPDESLLFPMYYALPQHLASGVNLTMGFPMRLTSVASFIALLRAVQRTVRSSRQGASYHYKDMRALLAHPYMHLLLGVANVEKIQGIALVKHLYYLTIDDMLSALPDDQQEQAAGVLQVVFRVMRRDSTGTDAYKWLRDCLSMVMRTMVRSMNTKEHERIDITLLKTYQGALDEFEKLCAGFQLGDMGWRTALTLIDRLLQNNTVHLPGEPLSGVQIMGMLETRSLDFDYLIIPSMNERIFPRRLRPRSFIPDTMRRGWLLPTVRQKEQAYAYHFYRLMARAREVHLLYNASQSGLRSGDPSRYLLQLKHLFGDEGEGLRWRSARFNINTPPDPVLKVEKRMEELQPFLTPGSGRNLSASSLKDYLACPLKFYLAHVLRKKLRKEPDEFMDAATQGTILHECMQHLYDSLLPPDYDGTSPCVRRITPQIIGGWLQSRTLNLKEVVASKVREFYPPAADLIELTGDSQLMAEVIERYVRASLQADLQLAPYDYIDNEHKVTVSYTLEGDKSVNMTFVIDRLDRLNINGKPTLRIVDYKTGSDDTYFKSVNSLFHPNQNDGNTKGIFQLMLYSLLYPLHDKNFPATAPLALSIYRTRTLEVSGYKTMVEHKGEPVYSHLPYIDEFRLLLDKELKELFDLEKPFEQTRDTSKCDYCDFKRLCGR